MLITRLKLRSFPILLRSSAGSGSRLMASIPTNSTNPVEDSIRGKLLDLLKPTALVITNDSWQHRHHAAMKASGGGNGETHFSVEVVSAEFQGKRTMQRHRMIYSALKQEFEQLGLHALTLKTLTPQEEENLKGVTAT